MYINSILSIILELYLLSYSLYFLYKTSNIPTEISQLLSTNLINPPNLKYSIEMLREK